MATKSAHATKKTGKAATKNTVKAVPEKAAKASTGKAAKAASEKMVKAVVESTEEPVAPAVENNSVVEHRGVPLLMKIREEQERRSMNLNELAQALGLSKPYLMAIFSFQRPIDRLGMEYLEKIAEFLKVPKAQVYCLAEILKPEDFTHEYKLEEQLQESFRNMRNDPVWMAYAPSDEMLNELPSQVKIGMAYMYQQLANKRFVEGITATKFESEAE